MSWMRGSWERLRETLARRRFEAEMDEEIRYHVEREVERLVRSGFGEEAARFEARRRFGDVSRVKEDAREGSGIPVVENALRDARQAIRGFRTHPTFSLSVVLVLGLGIGATTAIFSVVDAVLLKPLPYPDPDRLVRLHEQNRPGNIWNISVADFLAVEEQQVFESVAAVQSASVAFTGRGQPEQIAAARVTADWFRVLGVEPMEGRGFAAGEDRPGAEPTVVLGSDFRDRVFGAGADALGASVTFDDVRYTVIGVLGEEWSSLAGVSAEAWLALRLDPPVRRGPFPLRGLARLRPGSTLEDARVDLDAISRRLFPIYADIDWRDEEARITPFPLRDMMLGDIGHGLWLMFGAVVGVLLIAVANVGSLFLVRAAGREREMALRASLGAGRRRLAAQLLTECLVFAAIGGATGLLVAWLGLEALVKWGPKIPRLAEVGLDGSVLLWTAAVTLGSALLFSLAPLSGLAGSRLDHSRVSRPTLGAGGWARLRSALVAAEFALAFTLVTGAGLLLASFVRLQQVDPGYDPADVVAVRLSLPAARYPEPAAVRRFWEHAERALRETPGVLGAGVGGSLPPGGPGSAGTNNFDLLDRPVSDGESEPHAYWNAVSPGFVEALRMRLVRGRVFDDRDRDGGAPVVLVSESWAQRHYPDAEVLGARLYAGGDRSVAMTVVGVVGDVKYEGLAGADDAAVYEPDWQVNLRDAHLVVRGRAGGATADELRRVIAGLDADLPTSRLQTMEERTEGTLDRPRHWTTLLGTFAAFGLVLACVGVYGVLSHYVSTRRKEIGIRISLGAELSSVRRLVIGRGMVVAVTGILLGLVLSLLTGHWLQSLVFGISPHDPVTLALVTLGLVAVALVACTLPAVRATRVDPAITLRTD
ncbi:MAG TPA: ABC transporter permease [Longimicrobiales bacterium]|nr:ABC transporter permease [Longimicrobiales bacterium]